MKGKRERETITITAQDARRGSGVRWTGRYRNGNEGQEYMVMGEGQVGLGEMRGETDVR